MPQSTLVRARVLELLGAPLSSAALDELLFASKAEVEAQTDAEWTLSVTPDRLDLLSEGGLALHLQGATERELGLPLPSDVSAPESRAEFHVEASVGPLRPQIAGALLHAPAHGALDAGLLAESIRFQEIVHATIGRDRRAASLGLYPVERFAFPVRYSMEPLASLRFVPLDGIDETGGVEFYRDHPMAARYGTYGRSGDRCLALVDSSGAVLSLPPVLNSRGAGEARVGDRTLLLESTGTEERAVRESLGLMLVPFVARGWSVSPVPVVGPGDLRTDGRRAVTPHSVDLRSSLVHAVWGAPVPGPEVERRLARARLGFRPHSGGWHVDAPPWRPDLVAPVDAAEDVVLAAGVRAEDGRLPASLTRGRRRPEIVLRRRVATWLLGLGFAQPNSPLLVSERVVTRVGDPSPLHLRNPVSAEFAYVRDRLLLSQLEILERNTRHGYPQRFAEVGPVVRRSTEAEAGGETRYHAGAIIAADAAGFADAAALVDYVLRVLDVGSVREPAEVAATIPGRAARVRVAGEPVAELGEVHPRILAEIGVPVPVAWAEVDLTALWPLLTRSEAH